jgi:hypothetical protein
MDPVRKDASKRICADVLSAAVAAAKQEGLDPLLLVCAIAYPDYSSAAVAVSSRVGSRDAEMGDAVSGMFQSACSAAVEHVSRPRARRRAEVKPS